VKTDTVGASALLSYITFLDGSTVAAGGKFITNNTDYGGSSGERVLSERLVQHQALTGANRQRAAGWSRLLCNRCPLK